MNFNLDNLKAYGYVPNGETDETLTSSEEDGADNDIIEDLIRKKFSSYKKKLPDETPTIKQVREDVKEIVELINNVSDII